MSVAVTPENEKLSETRHDHPADEAPVMVALSDKAAEKVKDFFGP